ncbi:Ion channel [Onchocerca flexuosa]|uniref:Ion channel n=1 Tax=Onchocerca flexuosa TaxID=387005 RepID=A0A238BWE2_9BILA|nr:Ion channel [Onchocerca flexuosa]
MQSKTKMHAEHEFNNTKEIEKLYHKLSATRDRSKRCFLLYFFIIPLFIIIGGVTFFFLELVASQEAETRNNQVCVAERKLLMENLKASLEGNFSTNANIMQNLTNLWQAIQDTVIEIESCHRKRLFELMPIETFAFKNALIYSFSVYTTIGYGHLFPRTMKGRILTVVYAVIGIPLNVAFISDLGELIGRTVQYALQYSQRRILNKTTQDPCIEYKKFSLVVLIAIVLTAIIAIIVMKVERSRHWNYVDSLYYTFTTSTLIGLGDLTPEPSCLQFFVLMPLFLISETIFALAIGFVTYLYRYESVIMYKLIKHKISKFLLHRRLQHIKSALQGENLQDSHELIRLSAEKADTARTSVDTGKYNADVDAEIAELSAREMLIDKKIGKEIEMLEAVPSEIDLGILNAQMKNDHESKRRLKDTLKKWLDEHSVKDDEDMK